MKREQIIQEARERYEYAREQWAPIYAQVREDLRFSDPTGPEQWPEQVKRERQNAEGGPRPCLTFDQTGQFIRQVINTARRNKPAIKYLPVDDEADPKLAEILQGLARQTEHQSRADVAYWTSLDSAARGGLGYFRMILEEVPNAQVNGQLCAKIVRVVDFETVLPDPDFVEPDGSDMAYGFVEEVVPRRRFEKQYPNAKQIDWQTDKGGWFTKDHVRVCEYYRVVDRTENLIDAGGKQYTEEEYWQAYQADPMLPPGIPSSRTTRVVEHYKLTGEEVLEQSVFPGEYVPIFPVLGNEQWEEGKRKLSGVIRIARDPQIAYNIERNSQIETVALMPKAPYTAPAEAIEGYENQWKRANSSNQAFLPYNHIDDQGNPLPPPQRTMPPTIAAGWADLSERSKADLQAAMGQFEASVGNNPNSQSGRAVLALQDKADVGTYHYVDNLALSISHCGRVLTQVWPVIYDQPQIVRVLGEDDDMQFVRVDPSMQQAYAEMPSPDGAKVISINPGVGKYDVRVTTGPAFQTRQIEAAAEIGEMVNGNPQMMSLLGDVWVKMRNFPEADKIARRLRAMLPPQVQQAENEEAQAQMPPEVVQALQGAAAEISSLRQQLQQAQQQAQQAERKAMIDAQSRERVAQINAAAKYDQTELQIAGDLLRQGMTPPPSMTEDVAAR